MSGLLANTAVVLGCSMYLWLGPFPDILVERSCLVNVLVIAGLHAVFLFTIATRKSVKVGAHQYGRQLILCCEHFIVDKAPKNTPR